MWLLKDFTMNAFASEVKKGNYKKLEYFTWQDLKKYAPEEWELRVEVEVDNYSEKDSRYVTISWDGCGWPYEFSIKDNSFGEFLWNLLKDYNDKYKAIEFDLNTTTMASSLTKCAEAANKVTSAWSTSLNKTWEELQQLVTKTETPALENNSQGNLVIGDKNINEKVNEAIGASINRKENDSMDLFKDFNFGSCENDNVKMSMYGIAVKNATGTWVSYDSKSGNVIDVDILNFSAKYLYKMPVAIKDVAPGDVIIHNRKPMFVTDVSNGKLLVIDPAAGEEKIVLLTKNMFGFDFTTKVVNLFGNLSASASEVSPFGNMLPLMMLADGDKSNDMLPLMFLTNGGGNFDMSNPMMLYFLMKNGDKSNDMLPLYFFMNGSYLGLNNPKTCNCGDCDCDKTAQ